MEFVRVCRALDLMHGKKDKNGKLQILRKLLDRVPTHGRFSVLRLLIPQKDRSRPAYYMQTATIGQVIGDALGLAPESGDVQRLVEWRSGGDEMGINAGNLALSCVEVLATRQRQTPSGITCEQINGFLDRLASTNLKKVRVTIFRELVDLTTAVEMRWLIGILLKEVRIGLGDNSILSAFHEHAAAFYRVKCDLRALCTELSDPNRPWITRTIEVGTAFEPQHSKRGTIVEEAWRQMKGKSIVVERKFDGDRMLLHKDGETVTFISRRAIVHPEYFHFGELLKKHLPDRCILDGELVTWDSEKKAFGPRTRASNYNAARALRKELVHHEQNCFMAFDIVWLGDVSLLDRSLGERKAFLERAVPQVPGLLYRVLPGVPPFSILPTCEQDVHDMFNSIVTAGDEGIVLKDLTSPYTCGDKSGAWLKVKPDYVKGATDLDVLIMGGFFGQGHHGGKVAQFLCGVVDKAAGAERPTSFLSFCRVGTGFKTNRGDLRALRERLEPIQVPNVPDSRPRCYKVGVSRIYNPDVWYDPPCKSVVLTINCDNRPRPTQSFAAPYAPCFARCCEIRYDKPWHDCLTKTELIEIVAQNGVINGDQYAALAKTAHNPKRGVKRQGSDQPLVPPHLQSADTSAVQRETDIFQGLLFVICNVPEGLSKCHVSNLIARHGGHVSENYTADVTHVLAGKRGGIKWSAVCKHADIIHTDWLLECEARGELLPIRPRHRMHLAESANSARCDVMDCYGDAYEEEVDDVDVKQLLSQMLLAACPTDAFDVVSFETKHCGDLKTGFFRGCVAFFHEPIHSSNPDSRDVAAATLRRLGLEIRFRGGDVAVALTDDVTHVVVYVSPTQPLAFDRVLRRKSDAQRRLLRRLTVSVVDQRWVEESVRRGKQLGATDFSMRPESAVDWSQSNTQRSATCSEPLTLATNPFEPAPKTAFESESCHLTLSLTTFQPEPVLAPRPRPSKPTTDDPAHNQADIPVRNHLPRPCKRPESNPLLASGRNPAEPLGFSACADNNPGIAEGFSQSGSSLLPQNLSQTLASDSLMISKATPPALSQSISSCDPPEKIRNVETFRASGSVLERAGQGGVKKLETCGSGSGGESEKENRGRFTLGNGARETEGRKRPLADLLVEGHDVMLTSAREPRPRDATLASPSRKVLCVKRPRKAEERGAGHGGSEVVTSYNVTSCRTSLSSPRMTSAVLTPSHRVTAPETGRAANSCLRIYSGGDLKHTGLLEQPKVKPKKKVCYRDLLLSLSISPMK